jgi:hypothetical protein
MAHVLGEPLAQSVAVKPDYAKWMLDDLDVNFAISTRGRPSGFDHLGIQAEDRGELQEVYGRLRTAGCYIIEQEQITCCYARSEKLWIDDPAGIAWKVFFTTGEITHYGDRSGRKAGFQPTKRFVVCNPNSILLHCCTT